MSNCLNNTEVTKELQYQQAFRHDVLSEECLHDIRLIKSNNADTEDFSLNTYDADEFTNQAWRLLGKYIANNMYLSRVDLDNCNLTDENMTFLFGELVRSSSLKQLLLCDNEFGIVGVRSMIPLLRDCCIEILGLGENENFNSECFEVLVSALNGKAVKELYFNNCNITDISALDRNILPHLQELNLNFINNIGREGCITISNLLKKEGSKLNQLYLRDTGIDDEGTEILAASLKHNTSLKELYISNNNDITDRGGIALLKVLVDVSSIENTYNNSNNTLSSCYIDNNKCTRKVKSLIKEACDVNQICSTPESSGRAKVIHFHLNSQTMKELCQLQGIESSAGSIFADIEPALLPKVLWLIGSSHGQSELYTALVHTAPELLSYIDRKAKLNDILTGNKAKASDITAQINALTQQLACLTAQNADIHKRLELVELGDTKQKQLEIGGGTDQSRVGEGVPSCNKRQRS